VSSGSLVFAGLHGDVVYGAGATIHGTYANINAQIAAGKWSYVRRRTLRRTSR
jgi:hypothetical protein